MRDRSESAVTFAD